MDIEKIIIEKLSEGKSQAEISEYLKENKLQPSSVSSVEKRLSAIRKDYGAKTLFHLACILKNEKII